MATKHKRPKKQSAKKQPKKQAPKKVAEKPEQPMAEPVAAKAEAAAAPIAVGRPLPPRAIATIALIVVGIFLVFAIVQSSGPTPVRDKTSHKGERSTLQVTGTSDDTGQMPSEDAANALQGQSGATQATPQGVQSGDGVNLQASPTTPEDARNLY